MKRLAGLTLALAAIAAPAYAESPSVFARSAVLIHAPCPVDPKIRLACAYPAELTIYVNDPLALTIRKAVIQHERGHVFAFYANEEIRAAAMAALGFTQWREERFADAYAACQLSRRARETAAAGGASMGRKYAGFCRVLGSVG